MLHSHKNYGLPSLLILGALSACAPDLCSLYEGKQFAEDNQCGEGQSGTGAAPTGGTGGTGGVGANGGSGGNTGGDGGTGGGPPPGCTPTEGEAITGTCGVFVDANAPAGGSGTQTSPYNSITAAVAGLGAAEHIYVCGGDTHAGSIALPPGVALSGGLTCDTWTYAVANPKPLVEGDADAPGLSLVGAGETALTSIRIAGAAPATSGGSSIGLLASERVVSAQSIDVTAAAGAPGTPGADAPQTNALNGGMGSPGNNAPACNAIGANPGGAGVNNSVCATGFSTGGSGGAGDVANGSDGADGTVGVAGSNGVGQPNMGGGWSCAVGVGGGGDNGSAGMPGSPGSPGSGKGALVSTGFAPAAGGPGGNGDPGQGGGGGGGSRGLLDCNAGMAGNQPRTGASGGSGGAGGCGGVGATGGTGGGSSFAVVLLNAQALFTDSTFSAADGGAGGDGGRGQPEAPGGVGAPGGTGDLANGIQNGCPGGLGGTGGRGGGGGGGRGGHSAAIVFDGTAPSLEDSPTTPGVAGAPGVGLGLNPGDAGLIGTSCGVMDFTGAAESCL